MSFQPLVSVVLPTYNGSRYLSSAIDSILSQSYPNLECIVVVDGSTDETAEILSGYDDSRLQIIFHESNRGLPASLNTGLHAARGDFLSWTSDDNEYKPKAIGKLVDALKRDKGAQLAYSAFDAIYENGDRKNQMVRPGCPALCTTENNRVGCSFLFTKNLFEQTGDYDESLQGVEDYDFWIRARKNFRFVAIDESLYRYRYHSQSLTSRMPEKIRELMKTLRTSKLPLSDLQSFVAQSKEKTRHEELEIGSLPSILGEDEKNELLSRALSGNIAAIVVSPSLPAVDDGTAGSSGFGLHSLDPIFQTGALGATMQIDSLLCLACVADFLGLTPETDPDVALDLIGAHGGRVAILSGKAHSKQPFSEKIPFFYRAGQKLAERFRLGNMPRHLAATAQFPHEAVMRLPFFTGIVVKKLKDFRYKTKSHQV